MFLKIAATFAATIFFASLVSAQTPTGSIVGRVTDTTGAGVSGAAIRVRNVETNLMRAVESQSEGEYTISNLPPGRYDITIARAGFREARESGLELQVGQVARVDAKLEVGAVSETIDIKAETTLINTETSSRGDVITSKELEQMPLNGRDFNDLAFLVAGVQPAESGGKGSAYVANGARADASNVVIDGLNDQNPRDAGAQARPPLDSLQEFKFQTSGYSAEYGRLAGGVVNMVLRSGTNQLHGSLFEYVRNDRFDARNFFDGATKSELRRNQFGGTVSGPLTLPRIYRGHDRTFFLVSWESYRQVSGSNSIGIVPTALERQGDFSKSLDATGKLIPIHDPLATGTCSTTVSTACFPGNKIPPSRFSPIALQLAQNYPLPNLTGVNNYIANYPTPDDWNNFVFKVDQKLSNNDTMAVRALIRKETAGNPFSGSPLGTFGATTRSTQGLYGISNTWVVSPTIVDEFHGGLTRTVSNELSAHAGTNYAAKYGIPGTTNDPNLSGFPKITITGFETFGDNASNPIRYVVNDFNFNNGVTWSKGRHIIRFGADYLRVQYYQPTNSNFNGTLAFNGKATNDGAADFLLGYLSSSSRKIGTVTNHLYATNFGSYVQDDYKILPSLTLNLGLRYEIQGAPYEEYGQLSGYVPSLGKLVLGGVSSLPTWQTVVASAGLTGIVVPANGMGLPSALVNTNYDNFAPRVGFAWRPFANNRTVIRSGYGVFYTGSRLSAIRTDLAGGFPFSVAQSFTGSATNVNLLTLANPFPDALAKVTGTTTASGYETNPPSPYLQSWNFTAERDMGRGIGLEFGYSGSKGTHLGRKYDINQNVRTPTGTTRPYPGFGDTEYYSFSQNSSYNAGTVTVRKRLEHGLMFRANYTFGKSIDTNSGLNYAGNGGYQGAQNSLNLLAERGRSDFDIRHVFSMNFAWRPQLTRNPILREWQLAGSGTAYSGQPFTPQYSSPSSDLGQATRPDRLAEGSLANPTVTNWFNLGAFAAVPDSAFRFGNSGRNILTGPGTVTINLSLSREFQLWERHRVQFRLEAFNFANHTNLNLPADTLDKANAGTITGNKPPRIMQLALRYSF